MLDLLTESSVYITFSHARVCVCVLIFFSARAAFSTIF